MVTLLTVPPGTRGVSPGRRRFVKSETHVADFVFFTSQLTNVRQHLRPRSRCYHPTRRHHLPRLLLPLRPQLPLDRSVTRMQVTDRAVGYRYDNAQLHLESAPP